MPAKGKSPACEDRLIRGQLIRGLERRSGRWGQKNKAVDAVYRQRPCQPRILKSAHAIRWTTACRGFERAYVNQFTLGGQNWRNHAGAAGGPLWAGASRSRTIHAGYVRSRQNPEQLRRNKNLELRF